MNIMSAEINIESAFETSHTFLRKVSTILRFENLAESGMQKGMLRREKVGLISEGLLLRTNGAKVNEYLR